MNLKKLSTIETPTEDFIQEFTKSDKFGLGAVKGTFQRLFDKWCLNYKQLTDLVLALNAKYEEYKDSRYSLAELYNDLFGYTDEFAMETLEGEELGYFIDKTDFIVA